MNKFDEIVSDFLMTFNDLEYEDREKNIFKIELILNIRKLTESYEQYKESISILDKKVNEVTETKTNKKFDEVVSDYIDILSQKNYKKKKKNLIKTELLINLIRLTESYEYYRTAITVLSRNEKKKERKRSLIIAMNN